MTGAALLGTLPLLSAIGCSDGSDGGAGPDADTPTPDAGSFWSVIAEQAIADDPSLDGVSAATQLGLVPGEVEPDSMAPAQREPLQETIAADVAAGRMRSVAGWDLAETEVLLAVAAAESER